MTSTGPTKPKRSVRECGWSKKLWDAYAEVGESDRECAEAIEARILDVEAGNERTMFDQWRAGKKARPADRLQLVVS